MSEYAGSLSGTNAMKQLQALPSPLLAPWIHSFRRYAFAADDPAWLTRFPGTGAELWLEEADGHAARHSEDGLLCLRSVCLPMRQSGQTVFAIRFRAGALPFFTRTPLAALVDRFTPPASIWPEAGSTLAAIRHCRDFAAQCAQAEEFLLARLHARPELEAMHRLAGTMHEACAGFVLGEYAEQQDCHRSHLSRQFHATQGVSAKYYHRLCRFERFLRAALFDPQPSLAGLACEYGYYDQAHLHRDVRQFSRSSPLQLLKDASPRLFYSPRPANAQPGRS